MPRTYTPQLTIDEVILLIDVYFQLKEITSSALKREIICELSDNMRKLPFFPEYKDNPAFRSVAGMKLCLSRVGCADPNNPSNYAKGTVLQTRVFNYYLGKAKLIHSIASAIKAVGKLEFPILSVYNENIMGRLLPSYYEHLEQYNQIILNAKKAALAQGKTNCSVCGFDLEERYPGYGQDLLEPHITLPISQLNGNEKITLSDIVFVCPTCHKLAHSSPELIEEQNLRKSVKGR